MFEVNVVPMTCFLRVRVKHFEQYFAMRMEPHILIIEISSRLFSVL